MIDRRNVSARWARFLTVQKALARNYWVSVSTIQSPRSFQYGLTFTSPQRSAGVVQEHIGAKLEVISRRRGDAPNSGDGLECPHSDESFLVVVCEVGKSATAIAVAGSLTRKNDTTRFSYARFSSSLKLTSSHAEDGLLARARARKNCRVVPRVPDRPPPECTASDRRPAYSISWSGGSLRCA